MSTTETAGFRAMSGDRHEFGATPQEALNALMPHLRGDAPTPIVIWPNNQGDGFFTDAEQARLQDLKSRRDTLTQDERNEWERLVEASFEATVSRTRSMPIMKR